MENPQANDEKKEYIPLNVQEKEPEVLHAGASFRDRTPTIGESGKRNWVYPRKPSGKFYNYRTYFSWFLLAVFFIIPFVEIAGEPFLLFNPFDRKFVLFGIVFWPQDFYLFALSVVTVIISIVLFTAVFGRIWCGWACPQTIFMEMVFRKIEYWIEGNANQQRKLNEMKWNAEKAKKKISKWLIFYVLSFVVGNLLLSYIIGVDKLYQIVTDPPSEHVGGLIAMVAFSGLFFWIFTWFREQACTFICPYGRLQSVLLDKNSIIVAYDHKRGEPRGKFKKKNPDLNLGDCVDCNKCVTVCPTGIDIRNGTQLECVNCTACIDECDTMMEQVGRPKGLIRYTSENNIESGEKFKVTPRLIGYTVLLLALSTLVGYLLTARNDVDATILRAKGQRYQVTEDQWVRNLFTSKFINKTGKEINIDLKAQKLDSRFEFIGMDKIKLAPNQITDLTFFMAVPLDQIDSEKTRIAIDMIGDDGEVINTAKVNFSAPEKLLKGQ